MIERQLPFAIMTALNAVAKTARATASIETKFAFDRPTPFTQRAPLVKFAKKNNLTAEVFLRNDAAKGTPPVKYLAPGVRGGGRGHKRFEKALIAAGIMGSDEYAVPGKSAKLNAYGNLSQGQIVAILTQLRAARDDAGIGLGNKQGGKKGKKRIGYFYSRGPDGASQTLPRGIYARVSQYRVSLVLLFVSSVNYEKRYDFAPIIRKVFDRDYRNEFRKALAAAIRTAK